MKNLSKCEEILIMQKEVYQIICIIKNVIKPIGIDLLRQSKTSIPQQINFTGKLEEDDGTAMFFVSEKQQKTILNFSLDSLIITE